MMQRTPPSTTIKEEPLGRLARRLYAAQYRSKYRERHSRFHKNMRMRFALLNNLQRAFTFWRRHSGNVTRQRGVSRLHQLVQVLKLALVYRADPAAYYALNLYEPPHRLEDIEDYIGRHEMKNGLYSLMRDAIGRTQPKRPHSLTNKATFARNCVEAGLPHIPIVASGKDGVFTIHVTIHRRGYYRLRYTFKGSRTAARGKVIEDVRIRRILR